MQVWVMNADGTEETQLTTEGGDYPRGSVDGSQVLFQSRDYECGNHYRIFRMAIDGSDKKRVTRNQYCNGSTRDTQSDWCEQLDSPSRDGTIVFDSRGRNTADQMIHIQSIYDSGVDPPQLSLYEIPSAGGKGIPRCSPTESEIAFQGPGGIRVMTSGGGAGRLVNVEYSGMYYYLGDWSPDGSRIVFSGQAYSDDYRNIYVMDSDGSNLVALTSGPLDEFEPVWSPDGQWIMFKSYYSNTIDTGACTTPCNVLEVIKIDGSSRMIFGVEKHHAHWIP